MIASVRGEICHCLSGWGVENRERPPPLPNVCVAQPIFSPCKPVFLGWPNLALSMICICFFVCLLYIGSSTEDLVRLGLLWQCARRTVALALGGFI